jgi:hypothetical protein
MIPAVDKERRAAIGNGCLKASVTGDTLPGYRASSSFTFAASWGSEKGLARNA